jgi:hypothetical protein
VCRYAPVRLSLSNLYKKKGDKYSHLAGSAVNLVGLCTLIQVDP